MWAIYHGKGNTLVQDERDYLPEGFEFAREATEGEVQDELERRTHPDHKTSRAYGVPLPATGCGTIAPVATKKCL